MDYECMRPFVYLDTKALAESVETLWYLGAYLGAIPFGLVSGWLAVAVAHLGRRS